MDQSILSLLQHYGLPTVALMVFVAEFGLSTGISPKVALLLVGSVTVPSVPMLVGALVLVTGANLLGTTTFYLAVRTGRSQLAARLSRRHAPLVAERFGQWRRRFGGHDIALVGRLVPMVRICVPVTAGLLPLPCRSFMLGAAPAALVWSGTPLALGYVLRAQVQGLTAHGSRRAGVRNKCRAGAGAGPPWRTYLVDPH